MAVVDLASESSLAQYVAEHAQTDYQRYLAAHDSGFSHARAATIAGPGELFGRLDGARSAAVKLVPEPWDTRWVGHSTAHLIPLAGTDRVTQAEAVREALDEAREQGIELLTSRLAYDAFDWIHTLERAGWSLVDAMAIFLWDRTAPRPATPVRHPELRISPFHPRDNPAALPKIRALGRLAFAYSRWRNDPRVPAAAVDACADALIDTLLARPDAVCLVGWNGRDPVSMAVGAPDEEISRHLAQPLGYLWTIAVDPAHAGQGLGREMLEAFFEAASPSMRFVEIGTQLNNHAAVTLYGRAGLPVVSSLVTLHNWLRES